MRILKRIIAVIGIVVILLLVAAFFLPRHVTVARSIEIDAAPAEIYPLVADLRRTSEWSPWLELDPDTELDPETENVLLDWAIPWMMHHADSVVFAEPEADDEPGYYGLAE